MKLHLGCGQIYLKGYVNIDYPLSHHSVQKKSVADKLADITLLRYPKNSIEEIRLHHVFEHFDRATAVALVLSWNRWLKKDGILHLEVPDFYRTALVALSPLSSSQKKYTALRHIFGSQEAPWALHYNGWTVTHLTSLLRICGYEMVATRQNSWKGTHNLEVICRKTKTITTKKIALNCCRRWLQNFMVDSAESEKTLLNHWLEISKKQLSQSW